MDANRTSLWDWGGNWRTLDYTLNAMSWRDRQALRWGSVAAIARDIPTAPAIIAARKALAGLIVARLRAKARMVNNAR